ncbi:hypothetical protein SLS62_008370 [Diatrype stigma]|uniref:CCZ1/INTU/HSP4 first Longin domain-containing protein n=1 Tax=Diatrype stigma TaxID=117547 RepID=A0AAN9UTB8_9PEZI
MSASPSAGTIVPAQLGFLAIYNPTLGTTDETLDDQIVYYASVNSQSQKRKKKSSKRHRSQGRPTENISQDERNERLRQIGLAQGMVEFSRGFSGGNALDTIETEKTRVVLHELEPGWWILASIDLTKLPLPLRLGASNTRDDASENVEYSSREMKPAALLMQDLLRAHATFLLHHAASLSALFVRTKRHKFVSILSRYWDLFLSTWDVLLHGNPAVNVFGGIKIAACGELGIGVGEEDRGSGEREVLEGFVERTEGLVDLVVSKFGPSDVEVDAESSSAKEKAAESEPAAKWLGTGDEPGAEDGAIFLGVGALSRKSLRDVAYWMEDLYSWGEEAYGVKDNPSSTRQPKKTRKHGPDVKDVEHKPKDIPKETAVSGGSNQPDTNVSATQNHEAGVNPPAPADDATDEGGMTKFMQYLKLGYGTHWSLGASGGPEGFKPPDEAANQNASKAEVSNVTPPQRRQSTIPGDNSGRFLIGLMKGAEESGSSSPGSGDEGDHQYNSRVMVRALTVELDDAGRPESERIVDLGSRENELANRTEIGTGADGSKDYNSSAHDLADRTHFDSQDRNKTQKLRVVVYVSRPFVYTFLFRSRTDCLAWDGFYRSLHYQLAPLRKPLGASTAYRPGRPAVSAGAGARPEALNSSSIFDLVWDPRTLTIHSTIPNIPDPLQTAQLHQQQQLGEDAALLPAYPAHKKAPLATWSRAEALGTHNQILNTYIATRAANAHHDAAAAELERTCKTNRGWWVVWTRILLDDGDGEGGGVSGGTTPRALATPTTKRKEQQASGDDDGSGDDSTSNAETRGPGEGEGEVEEGQTTETETETGMIAAAASSRSPSSPRSRSRSRSQPQPQVDKEIFLIRRAGEHRTAYGGGGGGPLRALSTSYAEGGRGGGGADANAGRLAQGIGVDTKKYIEGLLSLTR